MEAPYRDHHLHEREEVGKWKLDENGDIEYDKVMTEDGQIKERPKLTEKVTDGDGKANRVPAKYDKNPRFLPDFIKDSILDG